jgi:type IV pilus assembly protein PilF
MFRWTIIIPIAFLLSIACIGCAGTRSTSNATNNDKARAFEDMGTSFIRQGNLRAALENLLEAEKLDPENADIKQELALVYRGLGEYQKAVEYFNQALKLEPRFPEAQNNLCGLYLLLKEWDSAIEYCQKAADDLLFKNPEFAYTQLGTAYFGRGNYDMAIVSFQQALKLAPEYSPAYLGLGYVYETINKWDWAIEAYKKSIIYNPDNANGYFRMGKLYQKMNREAEAQEALRHFLELVPEGPAAEEAKRLLKTM